MGGRGSATATGVGTGSVAAQSDPELNDIWTGVLSRLPDNWGKWGDDDEGDDRSGDSGNGRGGHSGDGADD